MSRTLAFPFAVGPAGVPAAVSANAAIRQQLEQLLFTLPGERVNRPEFGCGVQRLVFAGASPEAAAAAEYAIGLAIRRFLTEILLDAVRVTVDGPTLAIDLLFTVRATGVEGIESFTRVLEGPP